MKQLLALLFIASLTLSCKKAPAPAASTPAPAGGTTAAARTSNTAAAASAQPAAIKPMPAQIPAVVARVNGEAIERWEFDSAVKRVEARAGGPVPPDKRDEVLRGVLDQLIAFHLLAQESRTRKLEPTPSEIDARVGDVRRGYPTEDAFKQGLAAQGVTVDQVRQQARDSVGVQKIIETEIEAKVAISDAEVSAFYQQNLDRFKQDESVHASHILIGVPQNATPEQKTQARAKAQGVLKQLRAGGDFAALAKAESQDPGSAQNGGDLGFFPKGQMVPAFEEAAFKTKPGTISGVVETPFGFHIIKVHERRQPRTAPLAEVAPQIKGFLEQGQRETRLEQLVEQLKSKGKIEILV